MNAIAVIAKYWERGAVKTRLASSIGAEAAALLAREFLVATLGRLGAVGDRKVMAYAPEDRRAEFAELAEGAWQLVPQAAGDLGARMRRVFEDAFSAGASRVVLLGSDSPSCPALVINSAFTLLSEAPVVLGPTVDGGYYLVGAAGGPPPIFEGIDWSTSRVWGQTLEKLRAAAWEYRALPQWYDVDTVDDLQRLSSDLRGASQDGTDLSRLRQAVAAALDTYAHVTTSNDE